MSSKSSGSAKLRPRPFKPRTRSCKDCEPGSRRPAPHPGPRCATHWRAFKKASSKRGHERMVIKTYGLSVGEYDQRYQAQGGRCAICQVATGASKRLAVDHNHKTGAVRGLLCGKCNRFIGHLRDSADAFLRAYKYLRDELEYEVANE